MFLGTIDDNIRAFIAKNREAFHGKRLVMGCSGNFTIEKVMRLTAEPEEMHCNDVSLYTSILADAILEVEKPRRLMVREDSYGWLQPYLESSNLWSRPAMLMQLMKLVKFERRNNLYNRRNWSDHFEQFERVVADTVLKLRKSTIKIDSFSCCDVFDHFSSFEGDDLIYFGFFPFWKGGYESLYKRVEQILDWDRPTYQMFDTRRRDELIEWMTSRDRKYMFFVPEPIDGLEPCLISHKNRNSWVYGYSNVVSEPVLLRRKHPDTGRRFAVVDGDFRFTADTKIEVGFVSAGDIQHYKNTFLARGIDFVAGLYGVVFLADGKVFGFSEFIRGKFDPRYWYMLSDFPSEPKPHPNTAKLVVMLALSNEVRTYLEMKNLRKSLGLVTTAHTYRPVSMKYRGPMKISGRSEGKLNYSAQWPGYNLNEGYSKWLKLQQK